MTSIALLGFTDPESHSLMASISALDPSLELTEFTSETSRDELASNVKGALVWGAGTGLAGPSGLVHALSLIHI